MAPSPPLHHADGFTLIEVLLSLGMIALVVMGIVTGLLYVDRLVVGWYPRTQARLSAQECIAAARWFRDERGISALPAGSFGLSSVSGQWDLVTEPDVHDGITRTVTVTDTSPTLKTVRCDAAWDDGGTVEHATVMTYLSR